MREASRLWTWCGGQGAIRALAVLLLVPGAAMAAAVPEKKADSSRHYDARVELNAGFRAAPAQTQLHSVADLKRNVPDLGVTYDDATGVTRSLVNYLGFLTNEARSGEPRALALEWAEANTELLGLTPADLAEYQVGKSVYSRLSGVTHLYLEQMHGGIPVYQGVLHVNVAQDGRILSVNNQMVPGLASAVNSSSPALSAADAVAAGAKSIGLDASPRESGERKGAQQEVAVEHAGLSQDPIVAKLMYLPVRAGDVRLVWVFGIYTLDSQHYYEMTVDAQDGKVWTRFDQVASDTYRVYHRPVEAASFSVPPAPADGRTLELDPADTMSAIPPSPFGWHDTNGAPGAEFTTTQGNNVHAYTDTNNDGLPDAGSSPDGTAALIFNFPLDLTLAPSGYRPAAVTNLFHWNNLIHDIQYRYGFDEVAGNFQVNNYGRGGVGGDDVRGEAQDGGGFNNANFLTPADGQRPRMQMYLWNGGTPNRDGDLDNGIIVHEYGHGISNRQVGNSVNCLTNAQQPGEGISDVLALMYTGEVGDAGTNGRGIGTYALFQPTTGPGIRTQRYSTDPAINTWTYASIMGMAIPHGVGSVFAQAYWEVYWKLVDFHGFSPDLPNATGGFGNQRAMAYFNEGLKNTICNPTFLDVRDSVIAATTTINAGVDTCRVWAAWAAMGMGIDAISGGPGSTSPTNGFLLPIPCRPAGPLNVVATATAPNRITVTWSAAPGAVTYRVYRANGACPQPPASFVQIAAGITGTTYDDNTVSGGSTYAYVVTAIDVNGIESGFSNCDDATATGGCTTPPTFAGLTSATSAGTSACAINLAWSAATATCPGTTVKYNVYRSTTAGTPPSAATLLQSCLTTLTFSDTTVTSGTRYYYVVRAEDSQNTGTGACNNGIQDTNLVERSAVPGGPSATVTDNVENGNPYWNTAGGVGTNLWNIVTTAANSPTHSWFVSDPATISDQRLATISAGNIPAAFVLSFFHRFNTETSGTPGLGYDGHVLEYSLDGTTWVDILAGTGGIPPNAARITLNPYNATISGGFMSPLANRQAWSGDNLVFQEVRVNMADFVGRDVFMRIRFASDNSVADVGVWVDDITYRFPGTCQTVPNQAVAPIALAVDAAGNSVLQPNETAVVAPTWRNTGAMPITLTGVASNFQGPVGPTYTLTDSTANYGTIGVATNASCSTGGDCYAVNVTGARPATHWDSTVLETVNPTATTKTWTLHIGDSFTDVPASSPFYRFVETILHKNVTGGCTTTTYCPLNSTTREQMAVFVLVSKEPAGYNPPPCVPPNVFADVPETSPFCRWIEELANRGVVAGCGGGNYCPTQPVTREQMAIFVLRTLDPTLNPPACVPPNLFADVPETSPFCRWIEELANRGVVTGCGGGNYCPTANVSREQMGVFLAVTFGLTLYGL